MAQLIVRNLEADVKNRLRERASRHGRSVEEEVREILRDATKPEAEDRGGIGSAMRRRFKEFGLQQEIPELKGAVPRPSGLET